MNPESEWIVAEVPELRIVDDELRQAVKARQAEIAEKYANVTEAVREYHAANRPGDQAEAAEAIRALIEKIVLRPGPTQIE